MCSKLCCNHDEETFVMRLEKRKIDKYRVFMIHRLSQVVFFPQRNINKLLDMKSCRICWDLIVRDFAFRKVAGRVWI